MQRKFMEPTGTADCFVDFPPQQPFKQITIAYMATTISIRAKMISIAFIAILALT